MEVNVHHAKTHLSKLIAAESGEEVIIARDGRPAVRLVLAEQQTKSRKGAFGAGKGQIWVSEDWDSAESNEEIARLFDEGPLFPEEPQA